MALPNKFLEEITNPSIEQLPVSGGFIVPSQFHDELLRGIVTMYTGEEMRTFTFKLGEVLETINIEQVKCVSLSKSSISEEFLDPADIYETELVIHMGNEISYTLGNPKDQLNFCHLFYKDSGNSYDPEEETVLYFVLRYYEYYKKTTKA